MEWFRRGFSKKSRRASKAFANIRRRKIFAILGKNIFNLRQIFRFEKFFARRPGRLTSYRMHRHPSLPAKKFFVSKKFFGGAVRASRSGATSVPERPQRGATFATDLGSTKKKVNFFFIPHLEKKKGPRIKKRALFFFVDPTFYFSWTPKGSKALRHEGPASDLRRTESTLIQLAEFIFRQARLPRNLNR